MPEESATFTLDDGETLTVSDTTLLRVYGALWDLAPAPGALATAVLVMDVSPLRPSARFRLS